MEYSGAGFREVSCIPFRAARMPGVISPAQARDGRAILANDMHIRTLGAKHLIARAPYPQGACQA